MTASRQAAIIGTGNVGSALARLFARAGVEVAIANTRGADTIEPLMPSLGPGVHAVELEQALESDLLFVAIPFGAVEAFGRCRTDWTGKTVVDTTNAHHTPNWEQLLQGRSSTEYIAQLLPGAEVVKAFNQLPANTLAAELDPAIGRRVVFLATDSPAAGDRVAALIDDLGLAAVQLGRPGAGGRLIQPPGALVLRQFIERPLF